MSAVDAVVDGRLMAAGEATIPVTDEGLLRGDGAFEVARLYAGVPFALDEHYDRLERSAQALRLEFDRPRLEAEIAALLEAAGPVDGALRFLVTRGGRRIGLVEAVPAVPPAVALATIEYAPIAVLRGVKSLSYAANMLIKRIAAELGAEDALLVTPDGEVLEAPTSAFFYVLEGELWTPPLEAGILASITRRHLFEVSDARERRTTRADLERIEEAFIASSLREVYPVASIDGRSFDTVPGEITGQVAARMREHVAAAVAVPA
ncbi:MAG TPA: aminotransferase class IV [Solirubrobacterales bacterium]|jgi:branched-chain amino acid aminotransferase